MDLLQLTRHLLLGHLVHARLQIIQFKMLAVHAEPRVEHRRVRVHVQHTLVHMPHHTDARIAHNRTGPGHLAPVEDTIPRPLIVVQRADHHVGDLNVRSTERAAHLRQAGLIVMLELHKRRSVFVVHGLVRLQRRDDHRHAGPLDHGKHRAAQRICAHSAHQEIYVLAFEHVPGLRGQLRRIHQTTGDNVHPLLSQTILEVALVLNQPLLQAFELMPVEPAPTAKDADLRAAVGSPEQLFE